MDLNADFSLRASAHTHDMPWVPSPMAGVDRRMLDRIGDEVARATSIVRYAPGSRFSPHVHTGGEEFLVLDGVFEDEHGAFSAGSYIRNPPESSHTPGSEPGCTILVKLWQFDLADRTHVRIDTKKTIPVPHRDRPNVSVIPLYADPREDVRIEVWEPNSQTSLALKGGIEVYVIDGAFIESGETFETGSWLRLPDGATLDVATGEQGARVWVKSGHLPFASAPTIG